ncbi:MAG: hypothetical protein WBB48_09615 [Thermodesulfobacteriota bacterium]
MKHSIYKFLAFFMVLLLSTAVLSKEEKELQSEDFHTLDINSFNESILKGKLKEDQWTLDPVAVSLRFIGPFEGRTQSIERVNESPESFDATQVTILNKGLLDDSVKAVKYQLTLKKVDSIWVIDSAVKVFKCWKGRGHEDFSSEPCK